MGESKAKAKATAKATAGVATPCVAITGVCVRSPRERLVEVLVEVDGKWRRVFRGTSGEFIEGGVSEFVEVAGIERGKVVDVERV